ncbi:uncharacterized protein LOC101858239 isoform X2 [Aplysia californica]|uniref:Uncharacterized protein LOC101858239 isoform X2 n=1 Tax=Aplysia californica TaxID=6500 RepID=A0ABM1W4D6_APLCA|nr:uncharacterized protein LOC101858239 isoform X2 [Aplysia californica]XP_035829529.1 uncharacterized protein LOC101858239 isoform X2 [Aplysia californica]
MSGEEQPQPFASDEEMYHVWRGTAPAVCQRRGDDLRIFADALSCLERNSPIRLPATRRCIMSGEEQPQPFASDEETISESSRTHYHVWRGTAPAVCQRRGDVSCLERSSPSRLPATRRRSRNLRGRIIMSGEEQPQPFASDEEMNSESSRAPDGARHILPIIIEEPEPISSDEEMNSESSRAPDGARHILPIIIEEPEPISSDEEMLTDFPSPLPPLRKSEVPGLTVAQGCNALFKPEGWPGKRWFGQRPTFWLEPSGQHGTTQSIENVKCTALAMCCKL